MEEPTVENIYLSIVFETTYKLQEFTMGAVLFHTDTVMGWDGVNEAEFTFTLTIWILCIRIYLYIL